MKYFLLFLRFIGLNLHILWCRRLGVTPSTGENESSRQFVQVTGPWYGSSLPWFSILIGMLLRERGHRVHFVVVSRQRHGGIRQSLSGLAVFVAVVALFGLKAATFLRATTHGRNFLPENGSARATIDKTFWQTVYHDHGIDRSGADAEKAYEIVIYRQLKRVVAAFGRSSRWIVPGGVVSYGALAVQLLEEIDGEFVTYDSGERVMKWARRGVAAHNADVPDAVKSVTRQGYDAVQRVERLASAEFARRLTGNDRWRTQVVTTGETDLSSVPQRFVMIPANIWWDSAALGLESPFRFGPQAVSQVVTALSQAGVPVVVRIHPHDRHLRGPQIATLDLAKLSPQLRRNVTVIEPNAPVSTYALLQRAAVVVVWSSTIGVEAAMANTPVICLAKNYFSQATFAMYPSTVAEVVRSVKRVFDQSTRLSAQQIQDARMYYYCGQVAGWLSSHIDPIRSIRDWSDMALSDIATMSEVRTVVNMLVDEIPFAVACDRTFQETIVSVDGQTQPDPALT